MHLVQVDGRLELREQPPGVVDFLVSGAEPAGAGLLAVVVVVVDDARVRVGPGPRLDGARLEIGGEGLEARFGAGAVDLAGVGEHRGGHQAGVGGRRAVVARLGGGRYRTGRVRAQDAQQGAVGVLHAHDPVDGVLDLVEQVRNSVAGLGDAVVVAERRRILREGVQERDHGAGGPGRVPVRVPGVEPTAAQIADLRLVGLGQPRVCLGVLSLAHEAGAVGPVGAGVGGGLREPGALVEVRAHGVLEDAAVHVVVDLELDRADVLVVVHDGVRAGRGHVGEVEPPDLVAGRRVGGAAVPGDGRAILDRLPGGLAHHGVLRSRREGSHVLS